MARTKYTGIELNKEESDNNTFYYVLECTGGNGEYKVFDHKPDIDEIDKFAELMQRIYN